MSQERLPECLYTAEQTRQLDATAINQFGVPGEVLMARAGARAFAELRQRWPNAADLAIVCGGGNNGGDGYVVALAAREAGLSPVVYARVPLDELSGDARRYAEAVSRSDIEVVKVADRLPDLTGADVLVDALLGTGLAGEVRADYAGLIGDANHSGLPVLSIDVPSGLNADTGASMGAVVRADVTVTFIGVKQGLLTGQGPGVAGQLVFDDLGVPAEVYAQVPSHCRRVSLDALRAGLPPRRRDAHKGHFGHVLVVGGDHGYAGAVIMAAQAAARCGAGLVSVATRSEHVPVVLARQPEVMAHGVETDAHLSALLKRATVVVCGPGLGQSDWGKAMLKRVLESGLPRVLDADALNLLALQGVRHTDVAQVVTPHPGEAARLLDAPVQALQQDRFASVRALHERLGGTVLLKGAGTLIADSGEQPLWLVDAGNPGMASGGMGDVLSGVIGALMAQGLAPLDAARLGALLHATAADRAAADGQRGLLATDLLPWLRRLVNSWEC